MKAVIPVPIPLTTGSDDAAVISTEPPTPIASCLSKQIKTAFPIDLELHSLFLLVTEH
ncbi:hypothetical protein D3C72_2471480 [compost metagenome]